MNGFVNLIKPSGPTASDMVVKARKILNYKKIGHLGTLDPLAAGVLPLAVGKGTKLFDFLLRKSKTYRAFFTFGKTTDTLDSAGAGTAGGGFVPDEKTLEALCAEMTGVQEQVPPIYSAKSINGVRAYALARKGEEVSLKAKTVEIFGFDLLRRFSEDTFEFEIRCSSGTYIRSVARDMAAAAGTLGYMSALIRTASGVFDIEKAVTLDELKEKGESALLPLEYALRDVPTFEYDEKYYSRLANGVSLPFDSGDYHKIYCRGELFGVGRSKNGYLDLEFYLKV